MSERLENLVADAADAAGFDAVGFARVADLDANITARLTQFVAAGRHGDMDWLATTTERRGHPNAMWPEARTAIMLGMRYTPGHDPLAVLNERGRGAISVYAQGKDYHEVVKPRLKQVAGVLHRASGHAVKVFVDTAPLMEKPLAALAGIGWQGKHTNLVSRDNGSWLFLGAILTTAELQATGAEIDHCGSCRRCLDICPTDAFPAPYQLDARRCISYLTIEHRGPIAWEFRAKLGNRIYGCDDCLAVCPWNKFAEAAREMRFKARAETDNPPLAELLALDDAAFRLRFAGTPVKRTGRDRFMRNVLLAAGNSRDAGLAAAVETRLQDASPLVRGAAVWALAQLVDAARFTALAATHTPRETDATVQTEWQADTVT
ncbi:MAG: tRNA epoxyqueuosine(34) reductase QueG [Hyphomicrobiaceae bacterium]